MKTTIIYLTENAADLALLTSAHVRRFCPQNIDDVAEGRERAELHMNGSKEFSYSLCVNPDKPVVFVASAFAWRGDSILPASRYLSTLSRVCESVAEAQTYVEEFKDRAHGHTPIAIIIAEPTFARYCYKDMGRAA